MRAGSDEMLAMGSALSFGLAGGLLLGGAPRAARRGAFLPAVAMVLTLLDRSKPGRAAGRPLDARPLIPRAHSSARVAATRAILP